MLLSPTGDKGCLLHQLPTSSAAQKSLAVTHTAPESQTRRRVHGSVQGGAPVPSAQWPGFQVCLTATFILRCHHLSDVSWDSADTCASEFLPAKQSKRWHFEGPDIQQQKGHEKEGPSYSLQKVRGQHSVSVGSPGSEPPGVAPAPPPRSLIPTLVPFGPPEGCTGLSATEMRKPLSLAEKTHAHCVWKQTKQFNSRGGEWGGDNRHEV